MGDRNRRGRRLRAGTGTPLGLLLLVLLMLLLLFVGRIVRQPGIHQQIPLLCRQRAHKEILLIEITEICHGSRSR